MNSTLARTPEPEVKVELVNTSESSANVGCAPKIASSPAKVARSREMGAFMVRTSDYRDALATMRDNWSVLWSCMTTNMLGGFCSTKRLNSARPTSWSEMMYFDRSVARRRSTGQDRRSEERRVG